MPYYSGSLRPGLVLHGPHPRVCDDVDPDHPPAGAALARAVHPINITIYIITSININIIIIVISVAFSILLLSLLL